MKMIYIILIVMFSVFIVGTLFFFSLSPSQKLSFQKLLPAKQFLSLNQAGETTGAVTSKDNLNVEWQHTRAGLTDNEFIVTIKQTPTQVSIRNITPDLILQETNFGDKADVQVFEEQNISHPYSKNYECNYTIQNCTSINETSPMECLRYKNITVYGEDASCGRYTVDNYYLDYVPYVMSKAKAISVPTSQSYKRYKVIVNTPLTQNGNGWGSTGTFILNLSGNEFYDKTNSSWWNTSWNYRKNFTVQNAFMDSNLTDFPLYVYFNDSDIGGHALTNGNDIRFAYWNGTDALEIPFEKENYSVDAMNRGVGYFWVKVNLTNIAGGTNISIYYGNATSTSGLSGEQKTNTWNSGYISVWHFNDASWSGTGAVKDSKGVNNGTASESVQVNGFLYKGAQFDGINDAINITMTNIPNTYQSITVSCLSNETGGNGDLISRWGSGGSGTYRSDWILNFETTGYNFYFVRSNGWYYQSLITSNKNKWYYVAGAGGDATSSTYVNSSSAVGGQTGQTQGVYASLGAIGARWSSSGGVTGGYGSYFNGSLDECRISNVVRSAAWLKFEYRNMLEGDNELTWSAEESQIAADTIYPTFSNYYDNNASLIDTGVGLFNVTLKDTNGTVWLYINNTKIYATNITAEVYNVSYTFGSPGLYEYNWSAYGNGTSNNLNITLSRYYTVNASVDTTFPDVYILYPPNLTNTTDTGLDVNYSAYDLNLDSCWWTNNSGTTNHTLNCGDNITTETWTEGLNNVIVYANDTSNNVNFTSVSFTLDTTLPNIFYIPPTPENNSFRKQGIIWHNISLTENYTANVTFRTLNLTGDCTTCDVSVYTYNETEYERDLVEDGNYTINATACDYNNQCNTTENRFFTVDSTPPYFTNISDMTIYENESIYQDINASDVTTSISCFTVNNTGNFSINCSGQLINITALDVGIYNLNITINDTLNNLNSSILTITVNALPADTTPPLVKIIYPVNYNNYSVNVSELNYSSSEAGSCWWSNDSGNWNSSSVSANTNFTYLMSIEGNNNWTVYCNDSSNNLNQTTVFFYKDTTPPVCVVLSRTPAIINDSSTGQCIVILNCTDVSGINVSQVTGTNEYYAFTTRTLDGFVTTGVPNRWSIRPPANNLAQISNVAGVDLSAYGTVFRAFNRGENNWFEFIGSSYSSYSDDRNLSSWLLYDNYSYAVADNKYGYFNVTNTSSTDATLNLTMNSIHVATFMQNIPLSYESLIAEQKKNVSIGRAGGTIRQAVLVYRNNLEAMRGTQNYTITVYKNVNYKGTVSANLRIFYCNSSYSPTGGITVITSTNYVSADSIPPAELDTKVLTDKNSSYVSRTYSVINGKIGGIVATPYHYYYYDTLDNQINKGYNLAYANGTTNTNVSFNDTNRTWTSLNSGATWTGFLGTIDLLEFTTKTTNDEFEYGYCVFDLLGNIGCNKTVFVDTITPTNHPISHPAILTYNSTAFINDLNLNETHKEIMNIRIACSRDPDSEGNVTHNLTLRNIDGTLNYTINASFLCPGDSQTWITFNTSKVSDGFYRMNLTTVSGDNVNDKQTYLTYNNFTIHNVPPYFIDITNVSLYNNESLNVKFNASDNLLFDSFAINWTTVFGITQNGTLTNISGLSAGIYNINVTINDSVNNLNSTIIWINVTAVPVLDTIYPTFSAFTVNITNGSAYETTNGYQFNATLKDTNGSVGLEFNGTNYTATNISNVFSVTIPTLKAGVFGYYWWAYGNGTNHLFNKTNGFNYTVVKNTNTPFLKLNNLLGVWVIYPTPINASAYCTSGAISSLTRDAVSITALNNLFVVTGVANYTYSATCPENENYTQVSLDRYGNVTQNTTQTSLTFDLTSPQSYPTPITPTCSVIGGAGTPVINASGTILTSGSPYVLGVANWTFNCSFQGNINYTSSENISVFNITQNTTYQLFLTSSPSWTNVYGIQTTVTGSGCPSGLYCNLTLNSSGIVDNPDIRTWAVGNYNYTWNTTGNANYSFMENSSILTITIATGIVNGTINGTQGNFSATNGTANLNIYINSTNKTGYGTGKIYLNGTLINEGIMPRFNVTTLPIGFYNITFVYDGNENYTGSNETWWVNITLIIDIIPPLVKIIYPVNQTYTNNVTDLNYTTNETGSCWWSNDSGITNSTPVTAGINWTGLNATTGSNTWTVYCNDTAGNVNSSSVTFTKTTAGAGGGAYTCDVRSTATRINSTTVSFVIAVLGNDGSPTNKVLTSDCYNSNGIGIPALTITNLAVGEYHAKYDYTGSGFCFVKDTGGACGFNKGIWNSMFQAGASQCTNATESQLKVVTASTKPYLQLCKVLEFD